MQSLVCMHTRHQRDMDMQTCSKIPGVSWIVVASMNILAPKSILESRGVSYTWLFLEPKIQKYTGFKSGDLGGHHSQSNCLEMFSPNGHAHYLS